MRHFSLWYLEVKVHGLIMLKSPEVPSNTCPTSLREKGMIQLLYNIEFFRSGKTGSGKNHFMWSITYFISACFQSQQQDVIHNRFLFDLLRPSLYTFRIHENFKRQLFTFSMSEPRINTEHSGKWRYSTDPGQASFSHFHILLLHPPRHTCTTEAIWFILWLNLMSCEFTIFYQTDSSPWVSDWEHRITLSHPLHPDHTDHLESKSVVF